jgi:hypothetical protein
VTKKELIALLEEAKCSCDNLYEDAPDPRKYDPCDELSSARFENAAASFCDSYAFEYFRDLATRLSDAIYKLENDQEIR